MNCFRNQIVIEEADMPSVKTFIVFKEKTRHIIRFSKREDLLQEVKDRVKADVVNAIHCSLPVLAFILHKLIESYPSTTFRHCKSWVQDITDGTEQREIVTTEHNRAHRAAQKNVKQIVQDYFFFKNR